MRLPWQPHCLWHKDRKAVVRIFRVHGADDLMCDGCFSWLKGIATPEQYGSGDTESLQRQRIWIRCQWCSHQAVWEFRDSAGLLGRLCDDCKKAFSPERLSQDVPTLQWLNVGNMRFGTGSSSGTPLPMRGKQ